MIAIHEIASYVPAGFVANVDRKEDFGISDEFIEHKIGVDRVSRKGPDEDTSDMCVKAYGALSKKSDVRDVDVDCIVLCTQNPDGRGIPYGASIIHGKIGAGENCATFDIALGCSGYVCGLSIATSFMQANGLRCGLLFTCDPYSKILDPSDKNTALLFGDAATVTLLQPAENSRRSWLPSNFHYLTRGRDGHALENRNGRLFMNGRAVFSFSATAVPPQVAAVLVDAGLTVEDVDLFLFHQGSKFIIDTLRKRMGLDESKIPLKLAEQGNTVSSSIPLMIEEIHAREDVNRMVLSGFGVGLAATSCLLERRQGS